MIAELLGTFDLQFAMQIVLKIVLAILLGGIVGLERERRHRPAGVRTFTLVSVGSCVFTILSYHGFPGGDPSRIAAQIVSGIGFLGAGVMIQRKGTIYGLTSAAGIWAIAAVGMAVGTGNYFLAIFGDAAIYVVLGLVRQWFKADVARSTRRTLNTALRQVQGRIGMMGDLVITAIQAAVDALVHDNHELAHHVIEDDEQINQLRYQVEEECLQILRTHYPEKIQLRTVLAATHVATNLERVGDYAKEIAQIRLQMGHEPLAVPTTLITTMIEQIKTMLRQVVTAFSEDDVQTAKRISQQLPVLDQAHDAFVEMVSEKMSEKKPKHFARGASLIRVAYHLKRAGERAINIAEQIIFVRTGALRELDHEE
jgi:putative Mg2+ transporter-C (MgtC) family protein